jgi:hypothetical protein
VGPGAGTGPLPVGTRPVCQQEYPNYEYVVCVIHSAINIHTHSKNFRFAGSTVTTNFQASRETITTSKMYGAARSISLCDAVEHSTHVIYMCIHSYQR